MTSSQNVILPLNQLVHDTFSFTCQSSSSSYAWPTLLMILHRFYITHTSNACNFYVSKIGHAVCLYSPCDRLCIKLVSWNNPIPHWTIINPFYHVPRRLLRPYMLIDACIPSQTHHHYLMPACGYCRLLWIPPRCCCIATLLTIVVRSSGGGLIIEPTWNEKTGCDEMPCLFNNHVRSFMEYIRMANGATFFWQCTLVEWKVK